MDAHLIHECLSQLHSPFQMTAWSVHAVLHNYATKSTLVTMGRPTFTSKTAPSPSMITTSSNTHIPTHHPNSIWIQSAILPQYTFRTIRPMDTQTNRWDRQQVYTNSAYILLTVSDVLITHTQPFLQLSGLCLGQPRWARFSDAKITQADTTTIRMDCHPIQTNWCPHLCHPHHFYDGCPSCHNPPNLSCLGAGTKYAGLVTR